MQFSISPYKGDSPMKPWPSLAEKAFCLKDDSRPVEMIFYFDAGPANGVPLTGASRSSPPVIVLIHGLGDEADSWRRLIPLLSSYGCRVLALDLPGFGRSVTTRKTGLKNHTAAVLEVLEAAGIGSENPAFLAGNSMGAVIAEAAAFQKPELVKGLILIDGSLPGGPANPGLFALAKLLFSRKWYRAYRDDPEGAWASLYPYYADLDAMPREDREFLRERVMARVESPAQEQAFFSTQRSLVWTHISGVSRFTKKIKEYKGKIKLIWGENDRIIPLSSARAFRALRNDIELEIIPGAGHLPQQEKPEDTARIIADFVDRSLN